MALLYHFFVAAARWSMIFIQYKTPPFLRSIVLPYLVSFGKEKYVIVNIVGSLTAPVVRTQRAHSVFAFAVLSQLVKPLLRYVERRIEQREVPWGFRVLSAYIHRTGDGIARPFATLAGIR